MKNNPKRRGTKEAINVGIEREASEAGLGAGAS